MSQYDIFVSYSKKDQEIVDIIKNELEKEYTLFSFDSQKEPGNDIVTKIFNALDSSSIFMPIISNNSTSSNWCRAECTNAFISFLSDKIKIIPICIDDTKPYNFFSNIEYIKIDINNRHCVLDTPRCINV